MINFVPDPQDPVTSELVLCAFQRSFTRGQLRMVEDADAIPRQNAIVVALTPNERLGAAIEAGIRQRGKFILLGQLGPRLADIAGIDAMTPGSDLISAACCEPAPTHGSSESRACLDYARSGLGSASSLRRRSFCRYDFGNEWNNLGYGRITVGHDRWAIGQLARSCEQTVAQVTIAGATSPGAAVTLRNTPAGAVLWFARPVGPIDGPDWALIEHFISAYRANELPCRPYLQDIPHGYGAAATMRLDCDEEISSARPLLDFYRSRNRPLSLAIKTGQPENPTHLKLISDVHESGGSILSHSKTHACDWGGSAETAELEARDSKTWLESRIDGLRVRYAVSPFHQNPRYVPMALARAGYFGFVGGTIANDPEYMMARAGTVPFGPAQIISHTQSCMLHGDCLRDQGDALHVFKEAFTLARDSGHFFGYLDHPFSERYSYGWRDERTRIAAHGELLEYMENNSGNGPLLFVNEDTCLDFIRAKAFIDILYDETADRYTLTDSRAAGFRLSVGFHGRLLAASHG